LQCGPIGAAFGNSQHIPASYWQSGMASGTELLNLGIEHHRAGRLGEAEQIYRQILTAEPTRPQPWYLLGLVANQVGKFEVAIELLDHALSLAPDYADAICERGTALAKLGQRGEAIEQYRRAISLKPSYAEAHYNLGNALLLVGQRVEAVEQFRRSLELKPSFADAHNSLGLVFAEQKQLAEAAACFGRAVELAPTTAGFHHNLGIVLLDQDRVDEAIDSFRRAIELDPNNAETHYKLGGALRQKYNFEGAIASYRRAMELKPRFVGACTDLGVSLHDQQKYEEAEACQLQSLAWDPNSFETHNNIGTLYQDLSRLDEALAHYNRALQLKPKAAETYVNYGIIYKRLGRLEDSERAYQRALELKPDYAAAHLGLATLKLLHGDFENGWPEFEWRWKTGQLPPRTYSQPMWNGAPLEEGSTVFLHCEQGFGDAIQFVRFAKVVKENNPAATVIVECEPGLKPLFASLSGFDRLYSRDEELPPFDFYIPMQSLPRVLKTRLETIPSATPYLYVDESLVAKWREKLSPIGGFRIGINWHGRENHLGAQQRDLPLAELARLGEIPGVRLISLQKGAGQRELGAATERHPIVSFGAELDTASGAFMDTAAIMKNLDLVITSDTSIAHLAGALGVPVWIAITYVPDWRWLLNRADSPWYPTMRLFRQPALGDWPSVFRAIREALGEECSKCARD
jgi:Flp pilus assembly protein TadD